MSSFLWIALWSVLLMAGMTVAISILSKMAIKRNPEASPVFGVSGMVFVVGCLIPCIWAAIQMKKVPELGVLTIICVGLWLCQYKLQGWMKEIVFWLLCIIASIIIPADLKLFTVLPLMVGYTVLGTALYIMMRVFMIMDCVSGLSMVTLLAQGILLLMMAHIHLLPQEVLMAAIYIFVAVMAVSQTIKVFSKGYSVLGNYAAAEAGFIAGYIWMYVMATGYPFMPLVLYSYDIFEIIVAAVMTYMVTRQVTPRAVPFLLERAQASGIRPKKLTRFIFMVLVLTSFLSALFLSETPVLKSIVIAQIIVLCGTYYMLNGWGVPRPTFKDLASDIKHGLADLKREIKTIPLKEKQSPKRRGTKKK